MNIKLSPRKRTAVIRITDEGVNIKDQGVAIMHEGVKMVDAGIIIKFGDKQKTEDKNGAATRRMILKQRLNMVP